jgi:hypothetical protein
MYTWSEQLQIRRQTTPHLQRIPNMPRYEAAALLVVCASTCKQLNKHFGSLEDALTTKTLQKGLVIISV